MKNISNMMIPAMTQKDLDATVDEILSPTGKLEFSTEDKTKVEDLVTALEDGEMPLFTPVNCLTYDPDNPPLLLRFANRAFDADAEIVMMDECGEVNERLGALYVARRNRAATAFLFLTWTANTVSVQKSGGYVGVMPDPIANLLAKKDYRDKWITASIESILAILALEDADRDDDGAGLKHTRETFFETDRELVEFCVRTILQDLEILEAKKEELREIYGTCQECKKPIYVDDDAIDDYGVLIHRACSTPDIERHLAAEFDRDPVEDDHR